MKKLLTILILLSLPLQVIGADTLTFELKEDLIDVCPSGNTAFACLHYETNTIYLRNDLLILRFVISHEIGHWFMRHTSYQKYQEVFGQGTFHKLSEEAANKFNSFIWYDFALTSQEREFFQELILSTDLILL